MKMPRNYGLKKVDIKICISYYFRDIININDLDLDIILLHEISYENILIYHAA